LIVEPSSYHWVAFHVSTRAALGFTARKSKLTISPGGIFPPTQRTVAAPMGNAWLEACHPGLDSTEATSTPIGKRSSTRTVAESPSVGTIKV
jgi:hypothetical protein